jgi:hypothetical protein
MKYISFNKDDCFPIPENEEERIKYTAYFFAKVHSVVTTENHRHKYRGNGNIRDLLNKSAEELKLPITFEYEKDTKTLYIDHKDDTYIKELPKLLYIFKNKYRFQDAPKEEPECQKNQKSLQKQLK